MDKSLKKISSKIEAEAKANGTSFISKKINERMYLIINTHKRKVALITINALRGHSREVLAFGVTTRQANWKNQLESCSEIDLVGKLANGAFKSLPLDQVVSFIS